MVHKEANTIYSLAICDAMILVMVSRLVDHKLVTLFEQICKHHVIQLVVVPIIKMFSHANSNNRHIGCPINVLQFSTQVENEQLIY